MKVNSKLSFCEGHRSAPDTSSGRLSSPYPSIPRIQNGMDGRRIQRVVLVVAKVLHWAEKDNP